MITKKKLEEEDDVKDYVTKQSEFITLALGDSNMRKLKYGDVIQIERKGYYICDKPLDASGKGSIHLIAIPDGKASQMASKVIQRIHFI